MFKELLQDALTDEQQRTLDLLKEIETETLAADADTNQIAFLRDLNESLAEIANITAMWQR
jgi:hypothetical protein